MLVFTHDHRAHTVTGSDDAPGSKGCHARRDYGLRHGAEEHAEPLIDHEQHRSIAPRHAPADFRHFATLGRGQKLVEIHDTPPQSGRAPVRG